MRSVWLSLWRDERGFLASSETVLLGTIVIIGTIAGLVTVRDTVATELGDIAHSLLVMDHSYSYAAAVTDCGTAAGSVFEDQSDFCTPTLSDDDPPTYIGPIYIGPEVAYDSGGTEQP